MVRPMLIAAVVLAVVIYGYMRFKGKTLSQTQRDIKEKVDDTINNFKNNVNNNNNSNSSNNSNNSNNNNNKKY